MSNSIQQLAVWQASQYATRAIWLKNATGSKAGCYLLRAVVLQSSTSLRNNTNINSKLMLVDVEFRPHQRNKELHIEQFYRDGTLGTMPPEIELGLAALVEMYLDDPELLQAGKNIFASVKDYGTFFFSKAPFPKALIKTHNDEFRTQPRTELEAWIKATPAIQKQLNYQL